MTTRAYNSLPTPDNTPSSNSSNVTIPRVIDPASQQMIDILLVAVIVVIMLAAGCTIEIEYVKKQLRRPIGIVIGLVCQFVLFPPIFFGMAHALRLDKWNALGAVIVGTSPGGTISNLYTVWIGGDVALSVSMTAVSTLAALGMMPLNLFLYTRSWTDDNTVIPYVNIVVSLASVIVPVFIGMLIRRKFKRLAKWILVIGSGLGILFIIAVLAIAVVVYPEVMYLSWEVWFTAAIMPAFGLFCGYVISSFACLPHIQRRAISIETCAQNTSISATLIILSFAPEIYPKVAIFSALYFVFLNIELCLFIAVIRAWNCTIHRKCTCRTEDEIKVGTSLTIVHNGTGPSAAIDNEAYVSDGATKSDTNVSIIGFTKI